MNYSLNGGDAKAQVMQKGKQGGKQFIFHMKCIFEILLSETLPILALCDLKQIYDCSHLAQGIPATTYLCKAVPNLSY